MAIIDGLLQELEQEPPRFPAQTALLKTPPSASKFGRNRLED
jgi:hypothetical protein